MFVRELKKSEIIAIAIVFLAMVLVFFGPIFTIWSLNALFPLEIPYSFKTWAAVLWLITIFHGIRITMSKKE